MVHPPRALAWVGFVALALAGCAAPGEPRFLAGEALTHPGPRSIVLSLIPGEPVELYVEYGTPEEEGWPQRTATTRCAAEQTAVIPLEGLEPGRRYRYRVSARAEGSRGAFRARAAHGFTTLRPPGAPVRFGFSTDSHVYLSWAMAECGESPDEMAYFAGTLANIEASNLDFLVVGGDEAQTQCVRCPECRLDGESAGHDTVLTAREAVLRYRVMRRAYGSLVSDVPLLQVLGNHDGEAGFGAGAARCGHLPDTPLYSRDARLATFPVPSAELDGDPGGAYYAFESGDALFVVLDVMGHTRTLPQNPSDWTLGPEQMRWLEDTLAGSKRPWKFLFAHHLVGGAPIVLCYTYGRGGIRSTVDGTPTGRFVGEQARIHDLMVRHGASAFFSGHDHVFAAGEKDGVLYVVGGQAAGPRAPFWTADPAFQEAYDYDLDGAPDYLTDKGFVRVVVEDPRRATLQYVATDPDDPSRNGRVLYETALVRPGS